MDHSGAAFDLLREVGVLAGAAPRTADEEISRLQSIERCIAHLEALRTESLVAAADPTPRVEEFTVADPDAGDMTDPASQRTIRIEDAVREEIAAALRWAPTTTGSVIHTARTLSSDLPETLAALRAGEISGRHATVIADTAARISHRGRPGPDAVAAYRAACARLQRRLLPVARRSTVANTRAAAKRALARIDADGAQDRRDRERCTRDVRLIDEADGISTLLARLSTPTARAIMEAVRRVAANTPEVPEVGRNAMAGLSAGERRAHALGALVLGAVAPQVSLEVVLPTAGVGDAAPHCSGANHDDSARASADDPAARAALLDAVARGLGSATIDGEEVDRADLDALLADPDVVVTVRKLLADPVTGALTGVGRSAYRVPARLREFLVRRDGTCRFPGCRRAARRCQLDHAEPYAEGGSTDPRNLGPLCTRHHQLKTHCGWRILDSRADGSCIWVSPAGRRYEHQPEVIHSALENHLAHWGVALLDASPPPTPAPPPPPPPSPPPEPPFPF